jgi:hypothetical protein
MGEAQSAKQLQFCFWALLLAVSGMVLSDSLSVVL